MADHRRRYIDWLRGFAVVIMFMGHGTDAWTRQADRGSEAFYWRNVVSGFGATLFLLLAGVAIAYASASCVRRGESPKAAARQVARRGWQIFGIAFLFRLQLYITSLFSRWQSLLKVDILNIMGPSIAGAAWVWGLARTTRGKAAALAIAVIAISVATPYIRGFDQLAALPDPIESYIRPAGGYANFIFLPWAAFVFAGAAIGVVLQGAPDRIAESRRVWTVTVLGIALTAGAYAASYLPSPFPNSFWWTTSPAFFYFRLGIMMIAFGPAWLWSEKLWAGQWQPFVLLGQTSLFVYWVHVELVYGYFTRPVGYTLPFWGSCIGVVLLTILMYYLAKNAKDWIERKRASHIGDWRVKALTVMGL